MPALLPANSPVIRPLVLSFIYVLLSLIEQVLDSDGSGDLTSEEFCAAIKKLVHCLATLTTLTTLTTLDVLTTLAAVSGETASAVIASPSHSDSDRVGFFLRRAFRVQWAAFGRRTLFLATFGSRFWPQDVHVRPVTFFLRRSRPQDFSPRLYVSDSDFMGLTQNGAICNAQVCVCVCVCVRVCVCVCVCVLPN